MYIIMRAHGSSAMRQPGELFLLWNKMYLVPTEILNDIPYLKIDVDIKFMQLAFSAVTCSKEKKYNGQLPKIFK